MAAGSDGSNQAKKRKPVGRKSRKKVATTERATTSAKGTPWAFPKNTLEDAIRIPKAIEDKNAGNPMPAAQLAIAVGFRQSSDWRFLDLLRSANQYGLVTGAGPNATVTLTTLGQDVVAPSSPGQRSEALFSAFRTVSYFRDVEAYYGGKRIPEDEFFLNTITREFDVPRDRVDVFSKVFIENLQFLNAFTPQTTSDATSPISIEQIATTPAEKIPSPVISREPRGREFLDTCFVMIPFGQWFDRYYRDVYVPAIRDAGYEPVRADELFTTGSVVEQIWEQIEKATLLLADLSEKNANVFYELGLSHAARKPVVFTASSTDDVPFDLRHLRVIIYDVREPEWAARLRESISVYLRNAAKDPDKSIPHPFRKQKDEFSGDARRPSRK